MSTNGRVRLLKDTIMKINCMISYIPRVHTAGKTDKVTSFVLAAPAASLPSVLFGGYHNPFFSHHTYHFLISKLNINFY